jgi:hypothetical protein
MSTRPLSFPDSGLWSPSVGEVRLNGSRFSVGCPCDFRGAVVEALWGIDKRLDGVDEGQERGVRSHRRQKRDGRLREWSGERVAGH